MGMQVGDSKGGPRGEINVTPLVDIVLVLLIIFMVLTPSMLKELTANVPRKTNPNDPPPPPTHTPIVVEVTAESKVVLNTQPIAPEALAEKVALRLKGDRQKVVFFKIDDDALYGDVVRFMDIVKGAGALTLALMTED
jgi:biopolymer transport protein ExbD